MLLRACACVFARVWVMGKVPSPYDIFPSPWPVLGKGGGLARVCLWGEGGRGIHNLYRRERERYKPIRAEQEKYQTRHACKHACMYACMPHRVHEKRRKGDPFWRVGIDVGACNPHHMRWGRESEQPESLFWPSFLSWTHYAMHHHHQQQQQPARHGAFLVFCVVMVAAAAAV